MRSLLTSFALLAAFAIPAAAHADTVGYTITGNGETVTFALTAADYPGNFELGNVFEPALVAGTFDGTSYTLGLAFGANGNPYNNSILSIYAQAPPGYNYNFWDPNYVQLPSLNLFGQQLFTGTTGDPVLTLGTSTMTDYSGDTFTVNAVDLTTQAAAPSAVPATPEPSSLILLGTGILGVVGMARRRFGIA